MRPAIISSHIASPAKIAAAVILLLLLPSLAEAFQVPTSPITQSSSSQHPFVVASSSSRAAESRRGVLLRRHQSSSPDQQQEGPPNVASSGGAASASPSAGGGGDGININGAATGAASAAGGGGGSMMLSDDAKSQLFSAFTALDLTDQYDAVLTGLCAKILDDTSLPEEDCLTALQDPIQLVQEMNAKRIAASPRSLMALLDAVVRTQDCAAVATIMQLAAANNNAVSKKTAGIQQYGAQQSNILLLPPQPTSRVKCPDGSFKTRTERLDSVSDVPTDEREKESLYALAFGGLVALCALVNLFGMNDISFVTNGLLTLVVTVGVLDNFYDLVKSSTEFIGSQLENNLNKDKDNNQKKIDLPNVQLPTKDALPLGLGTGQLSGSTVRGLTRLLTVDAEREAQCEAAAFYAAYVLGLPSFPFRPNALEGSVLVLESAQQQQQQAGNGGSSSSSLPPLLSGSGILRMLIWLMAPVAMENSLYPQLIMSDPREASGFLKRLEDYALTNAAAEYVAAELWWQNDDAQEKQDLLKWAYTEADLLLRENRGVVKEISNRLTGGAATIGDCVAAVEDW